MLFLMRFKCQVLDSILFITLLTPILLDDCRAQVGHVLVRVSYLEQADLNLNLDFLLSVL